MAKSGWTTRGYPEPQACCYTHNRSVTGGNAKRPPCYMGPTRHYSGYGNGCRCKCGNLVKQSHSIAAAGSLSSCTTKGLEKTQSR